MQIQPQEFVAAAGRDLLVELLRAHHHARLRVTGGSMMPAILPGDVVLLRATPREDEIRAGDVVLFARDQRFFLHRVVQKGWNDGREGALITQGDSLLARDPPLAVSDVLAVATKIERRGSAALPVPPQSYFLCHALRRISALVTLFFVYARIRCRLSKSSR